MKTPTIKKPKIYKRDLDRANKLAETKGWTACNCLVAVAMERIFGKKVEECVRSATFLEDKTRVPHNHNVYALQIEFDNIWNPCEAILPTERSMRLIALRAKLPIAI